MTTLATGLNTANRATMAAIQGNIYFTNNYDDVKVWDGISSTMLDAGIEGPAAAPGSPSTGAGGFSNGSHQIRYRYKNTKTGYVSNPSPALVVEVSGGNGVLTFSVGGASNIVNSSDTKVDQIVVEATPVGGGTFYEVGTVANSGSTIAVGMADTSLFQQFNSDAAYGSSEDNETYSSEIPPLGTIILEHRGQCWIMGDEPYAMTGLAFTNGDATVTGTGFTDRMVGRVILRDGDSTAYEIASYTSSTEVELSTTYGGVTGTGLDGYVISKFPNRGYYSRPFYPEQFYPSVWARDFLANTSDQLSAAVSRKDGLYIFGKHSAERLIYNADPSVASGAVISKIQGRRGCYNQRCLVEIEGSLISWDRQGMWIVGEVPQHISRPIDPLLKDYVDFEENTKFHASYDPVDRTVMFFFVQEGDTQPRTAACFEIDTGRWFLTTFLQGITSSGVVPTTDGQVLLMLGDENGYTWYYGMQDTFDGVPSSSPSVVTVNGTATTTVFPVDETLPTTAPTLAGVMVYNPATGDYGAISSNTASTITSSVAFSSAPADNQELYLGPIDIQYISKWWVGSGQDTRKNPPYLLIKLYPGSASGTMRVYFYADMATTPSAVTALATDTWPDGVQPPTDGDTYLTVELDGGDGDGVISVPIPIEWEHAIQFKLTSIRPDGDFKLLDAQIVLTRTGESSDVGT